MAYVQETEQQQLRFYIYLHDFLTSAKTMVQFSSKLNFKLQH